MPRAYAAVRWDRRKRLHDLVVAGVVVSYVVGFVLVGTRFPSLTLETLLMRALGTCAFLLLHVVLCIGPLARLDARFLPLLYNRRHLGVATFLVALAHAGLSVIRFHASGDVNPLVSVLAGDAGPPGLQRFPFQPLGLAALVLLFLLAATSHDFWLANLSPPDWKRLHMSVYLAYALLVMHVVLGALQGERHPAYLAALATGCGAVLALHLAAGWREVTRDAETGRRNVAHVPWVDVAGVHEIGEKRAKTVFLSGERVAVFRYDGKISAVSAVCAHQNGPLDEGRIEDGCITCPWHGHRFRPESGRASGPFPGSVPTFSVRVLGDRVQVDPRPHAPGTPVEPARIPPAVPG